MRKTLLRRPLALVLARTSFVLLLAAGPSRAAQDPPPVKPPTPELKIARTLGEIKVDGDLSDAGWRDIAPIEQFWETNRTENGEPPARTVARLAFDDHFFYAAFEFADPNPQAIRAFFADRDNTPSDTDYGGILLDTKGDSKAGILFLVNPNNIQYDAINSDASGEDNSYDLYWDSATRRTAEGWRLEMRIPFTSLRYGHANPQTWSILLYRNYPRDFRYQMFSAPFDRGVDCFVCNANKLSGLVDLPSGGHLVAAPFATAGTEWRPAGDLGSPLERGSTDSDFGADLKWTPTANLAIDAAINPDFSQIESDAPQISANERFALFFPERRPFFLEGLDLYQTPLQAVYTRTITSPDWGVRATGRFGSTSYTALVAEDEGGGSVIIPGPQGSQLAPLDEPSKVGIARFRRDFGGAAISFLATAREIDGGAYNRVYGPDFRWRKGGDTVTGQLLWSESETPNDPTGGIEEWDGRRLSSHAAQLEWNHSRRNYDVYGFVKEIGDEFRADLGFLPQVGYREALGQYRRVFYPKGGFFRSIRGKLASRRSEDTDRNLLLQRVVPGIQFDGRLNSFGSFDYKFEKVRAGSQIFDRQYLEYYAEISPGRRFGQISIEGFLGGDVDFVGERPGHGGSLELSSNLRPTEHLDLGLSVNRRWLDVDSWHGRRGGPLFTAQVARLRATYTFSSRLFLRYIGELSEFDPGAAADDPTSAKDFASSALVAYKLNWQTVLFVGFADQRTELAETGRLEPLGRRAFVKVSYALQR